jgi:predicted nucleic acid-binding protein
VIPLAVYYEIQRGLLANDSTNLMRSFEELCEVFGTNDLTKDDMNTAAVIYADRKGKGKSTGDTDLLIAAQCITHGYTLVTNNTKHFDGIDGLNIVDWAANAL